MKHDDCQSIRPYLGGYATDALDDATKNKVREHLDACPGCRQRVEQLRGVAHQVSGATLATEVPELTPAQRARAARGGVLIAGWKRSLRFAAAAAVIVALIALWRVTLPSSNVVAVTDDEEKPPKQDEPKQNAPRPGACAAHVRTPDAPASALASHPHDKNEEQESRKQPKLGKEATSPTRAETKETVRESEAGGRTLNGPKRGLAQRRRQPLTKTRYPSPLRPGYTLIRIDKARQTTATMPPSEDARLLVRPNPQVTWYEVPAPAKLEAAYEVVADADERPATDTKNPPHHQLLAGTVARETDRLPDLPQDERDNAVNTTPHLLADAVAEEIERLADLPQKERNNAVERLKTVVQQLNSQGGITAERAQALREALTNI